MDHLSIRFYIPGFVHLLPIYSVAFLSIDITNNTSLYVLIGVSTSFFAAALPVGWIVYNCYRQYRFNTTGGYEYMDFIILSKQLVHSIYQFNTNDFIVNVSNIVHSRKYVLLNSKIYYQIFHPFEKAKDIYRKIRKKGYLPQFGEHISDYALCNSNKQHFEDYSRSISSVRYSLEASFFGFFIGIINALALFIILDYFLHQNKIFTYSNKGIIYYIAICYILYMSYYLLIKLLPQRWKHVKKEHHARQLLFTILNTNSNNFNIEKKIDLIPEAIKKYIDEIKLPNKQYAAFDLDNTLLLGDIGEAVFASLITNEKVAKEVWDEYIQIIDNDRKKGCKMVIEAMNGMSIKELHNITEQIIANEKEEYVLIDNYRIPIPKPNKVMLSIITYLKLKGIKIHVVSATNNIVAEIACWKYFGIENSNVIGAYINNKHGNIEFDGNTPIPFGKEKVNFLKNKETTKACLTAGDALWDLPLLNNIQESGMTLWLGNKSEFDKLNFVASNTINLGK